MGGSSSAAPPLPAACLPPGCARPAGVLGRLGQAFLCPAGLAAGLLSHALLTHLLPPGTCPAGAYGAAVGGAHFPSPASRLSVGSVASSQRQQLQGAAQQAAQLGALQDALGARALQDALSARSELRSANGAGMPQLAGTAAGRLLAAGQGRALLGHQHSADATALPPPPAHPGSSMPAGASGTTLAAGEGSPAPAHAPPSLDGHPLSPEVQQALLAQLLGLGLQDTPGQGQHHGAS